MTCALLPDRQAFIFGKDPVQIHIMALYNLDGGMANYTEMALLSPEWEYYINNKSSNGAYFPFNVSVTHANGETNCTLINEILETRINNHDLPVIDAIIAEGDNCGPGTESARVAAKYKIPIILTSFNPDRTEDDYKMPDSQNTSFLMVGSTVRTFRELVKDYVQTGVKSVIAVGSQRRDKYNSHSCHGTADYLETLGVEVKRKYTIEVGDSTPQVLEIINEIAELDPDAVLWCDWRACTTPEFYEEFFPLEFFRDIDYLPKVIIIAVQLSTSLLLLPLSLLPSL
jgi:hypothetical protein